LNKKRLLIQWIVLVFFVILLILRKPQIWMGFVFLSVLLASIFGRFYCRWACPINTLIRPIAWLGKKIGLQRESIPIALKSEKPKWILFFLFLVGLGYTAFSIIQGNPFPLPLIVIPLGLLTTLFINEKSWHRFLCPWGVLFSFTVGFAKKHPKQANCDSCSTCVTDCQLREETLDYQDSSGLRYPKLVQENKSI